MSESERILRAALFAARKHRDQKRKTGSTPYINHPLDVAHRIVSTGGIEDPEIIAAALLHDTVEDTDTTIEELRTEFGGGIAGIVAEVTDDRSLSRVDRKRRQVEHAAELSRGAQIVKLADKLSNLSDLVRRTPPGWSELRIRGYFVWSWTVVEAIGPVEAGLWDALSELFGGTFEHEGRKLPTLPPPEDRAGLLEAYYEHLARG